MITHVSASVEPGGSTRVEPPREAKGMYGPVHIPWIVQFGQALTVHVASREQLAGLRDALTAAPDAAPDEP